MKPHILLMVALVGLVMGRPALGQTTKPGAYRAPSTGLPSGSTPNAVPANATTPTDADGAIYPNGVPARNMTGGTQRADQPPTGRAGTARMPAVTGSQQPYRIHKGRPSSKNQPVD